MVPRNFIALHNYKSPREAFNLFVKCLKQTWTLDKEIALMSRMKSRIAIQASDGDEIKFEVGQARFSPSFSPLFAYFSFALLFIFCASSIKFTDNILQWNISCAWNFSLKFNAKPWGKEIYRSSNLALSAKKATTKNTHCIIELIITFLCLQLFFLISKTSSENIKCENMSLIFLFLCWRF